MTPPFRSSLSLLALVAMLAPRPASAQPDEDKATARQLGQQGQVALDAGDWATAEDHFRRADALYHAPSLVLGLARAQSHEGKVVEAWESYHRIIQENVTTSPVFVRALHDATTEIGLVEARRSRLTLRVTGPDAPAVTMDGAPVKREALGIERLVNPGHHTVVVTADGWQTLTRSVDIMEGRAEAVSLGLERGASGGPAGPVAAESGAGRSSPSRVLGIAALAVGGAGLLTGIITGIVALGDHSTLEGECRGGVCSASQQSALSAYHTMGAVSTVGFVVAGVGAASGVVLLLTAPARGAGTTKASLSPYVGPWSAGVVGRF